MNLYPNLYALLESDSHARRLFERAPAQIRRQLLVRNKQPKNNALPCCHTGERVVFRFFKKT